MIQRAQNCFLHNLVTSSTQKNFRASDVVESFNVFPSAENNPGVLNNNLWCLDNSLGTSIYDSVLRMEHG